MITGTALGMEMVLGLALTCNQSRKLRGGRVGFAHNHPEIPIQPAVAHMKAGKATEGIIEYIAAHPIDLLVTVSAHRSWRNILDEKSVTRKLAYAPPVPMLAIYDDGKSDRPHLIEDLSNLDYAL